MNSVHTCERCGYVFEEVDVEAVEIEGLPDDFPTPPPIPEDCVPHPAGVCPSHFKIGDKLWWVTPNLDLPPVKAIFARTTEIDGPVHALIDNEWVKERDSVPLMAEIIFMHNHVFPQHLDQFGKEFFLKPQQVPVDKLVASDRWPVFEVD